MNVSAMFRLQSSNPLTRILTSICLALLLSTPLFAQTTLRIASVDNADMLAMRDLLTPRIQNELGVRLSWEFFQESVLRKQVDLDLRTGRDQFDIIMIGSYETPILGARGWLEPYPGTAPSDYISTIIDALSHQGETYALPFYGESSITFYRADWLREAGLTMPDEPSWDDIERIAAALHQPNQQRYGICLRAEPGWGSNMALINTMANTHGGRWYDMDWQPQLDSEAWEDALTRYVRLVNQFGPPNPATLNFNRLLSHFRDNQCAIWIDATVAASLLPQDGSVGYASAPHDVTPHGKQWLWAWALGVPHTSPNARAAWDFIEWATSAEYHQLVADNLGPTRIPPGTLVSLYNNPTYRRVAPFADITLEAIQKADSSQPTLEPSPYLGIQFVGIPEFAFIADQFGKKILQVVEGDISVRQALEDTQQVAEAYMAIQQRVNRAKAPKH